MFDIKGPTVIVQPEYLLIPEFKYIWESDKSKTKDGAMNIFSYIYFTTDYRSPYKKSYPESLINDVVKKEVLKDESFKVTDNIESAINVYKDLQYSQALKTLDAAMNTLNVVNSYLKDFNLDDIAEKDKANAVSGILSNIEKLPKVLMAIESAKTKVEKDMLVNDKLIRGKGSISSREKPKHR